MLAQDRITITLDGRSYTLRPTLQAIMRLERSIGLPVVLKGILDGNVTVMATLIRETAAPDHDLAQILGALTRPTLAVNLSALRTPLMTLLLAIYGVDPEAEPKPIKPEKAVPLIERLAELYRIATGWLGWTPAVAWDATPTEITEAYAGRIDMLSACFGGGSKAEPELTLDEKFAGLAMSLRARKVA